MKNNIALSKEFLAGYPLVEVKIAGDFKRIKRGIYRFYFLASNGINTLVADTNGQCALLLNAQIVKTSIVPNQSIQAFIDSVSNLLIIKSEQGNICLGATKPFPELTVKLVDICKNLGIDLLELTNDKYFVDSRGHVKNESTNTDDTVSNTVQTEIPNRPVPSELKSFTGNDIDDISIPV